MAERTADELAQTAYRNGFEDAVLWTIGVLTCPKNTVTALAKYLDFPNGETVPAFAEELARAFQELGWNEQLWARIGPHIIQEHASERHQRIVHGVGGEHGD